LVLLGLGLWCAAEVRAQPAPATPPPAAPAPPPAADAGVAPAPSDAATAPPADAPSVGDAGAPETAPAAPGAAAAPATEEAPSTGSGLFESSQTSAPSEGAPAGAAAESPGFDFGGYVRGDVWVGKYPGVAQPEVKAGYGEFSLKINTKREKYGDAFAEARVRYGLQDHEQRVFLDLREAYVNAYLGPVDLRLGQQIVIWGRADAFNPTSNIAPLDLRIRSPVEDDRRLGNVGLRAFLNFEPMRLEGVWMPLYVPAELPSGIFPDYVVQVDPQFPDTSIESSLGAVRLHLELASFETSVSYLHGYAPLPGFVLDSFTGGPSYQIRVSRTAYQHDVFGFDFSTAFGDAFALRGEAAYRKPTNWEEEFWSPHPDLQYVLGVDRTFGTVSVIAQYMGRYVFDWQLEEPLNPVNEALLIRIGETPSDENYAEGVVRITDELRKRNQILFGQRADVQHMATVRIEWLLAHDTLSLSALGMMNFTTKEWLLFPKAAYKLSDALSATVGAEAYSGPEDTLFGAVEAELSAGYAELRYSF
jgi:hypothetical protein